MEELYVEGVAIHGGPEPCGHGREAVVEASVGVRVGWAIEPRNWCIRGADVLTTGGRQHCWRRFRESSAGLAGSKNLCMRGISMRENREIQRLPARLDGGAGRAEKAEAVIP
jgi:hypothetical protein